MHRCLNCLRGFGHVPTPLCPVCHRVTSDQTRLLYNLYEENLYDYIPGRRAPLFVRLWRVFYAWFLSLYSEKSALPPLPTNSPLLLDHPATPVHPLRRTPGRG